MNIGSMQLSSYFLGVQGLLMLIETKCLIKMTRSQNINTQKYSS